MRMNEAIQTRKKADAKIWRLCQEYFRNNDGVLLDVGAYTGAFESKIVTDRTVAMIAVEPNPVSATKLRQKFPKMTVIECAVGWPAGVSTMYETAKYNGKDCSMFKESAQKQGIALGLAFQVEKRSLNSIYESIRFNVDLLFMNCEGGEYEIFDGPWDFLNHTKMVYIHLHTKCKLFCSKAYSEKRKMIVQKLKVTGFKMISGMKDLDSPAHVVQLWKK